ncbi:GNAT family N-acetyltransferase [Rhizobium azibense]|uniref:Acetyltransferase (GNAT) family protein n=1 Tax=Rhizobium azibense TaxID=1136135 RepID=A0A4R3RWJ0_9HYPH|nr:GNAT family N-acetyltransferase [Rhizobium azibense]TCU40001.1 acetyltransferase (GNAT) family protein [Rhizobium azibense]
MAIVIEPIAVRHIESYHQALDVVSRERRYLTFLEAPPLEDTREFVLDMIENKHPQFVAVRDGEVVGWCDIRRHSFPSHAHRGSLGMGIISAHRGQGIGSRLMETTLKQAREYNIIRVELSVHADNARAIRLYEKAGFVSEGVSKDAVRIDGRYIDVVNMALIFSEA